VGLYTEHVLPRIVDVVLRTRDFDEIRARVCAGLRGDVVEIGFGSGLNVPHYPEGVTGVWAVEPSSVARRLAERRVAASPVPVRFAGLDGERLDLPDARFDCALSTMTLCTIPDVGAALRELRRVLVPGGRFHFAEHGHSPEPKVARRQRRFEPVQKRLAGGCHLTRDVPALVVDAGFDIAELDTFYMKGPKPWGYMFVGQARRP
jgi:ubiquinone/menaquinone biosynthesis C-methylase UbiE